MQQIDLKTGNDTLHLLIEQVDKQSSVLPFYKSPWFIAAVIVIVLLACLWLFSKQFRIKQQTFFQSVKPKKYGINLPGFQIEGEVQYNTADQEVAWKFYIELATRVSGKPLADGAGILRETLSSLHDAHSAMRDTLKASAVELSRPPEKNKHTVTTLSLDIMNKHLYPFLSEWHPRLEAYEDQRVPAVPAAIHEKNWPDNAAFRTALRDLQTGLKEYIDVLLAIAQGKNK